MEITNAEFVISNTDVRKIQPHQYADRTKGAGHDFRYSR